VIRVPIRLIHELVPTLANVAQRLRRSPQVAVLVHDSVRAIRLLVEEELKTGAVVGGEHLKLHACIVVPTPNPRNKYPKKVSVLSPCPPRVYARGGGPAKVAGVTPCGAATYRDSAT